MGGRWFDVPTSPCPSTPDDGAGRAERTRARLVWAAARHFAAHGYHCTTVREVLAETGVTKGALYFHFDSKLGLARAVCDESVGAWARLLEVIAARRLDPLQELLVQADTSLVRFAHDLPFRAALRVGAEAAEFDGMLARWRAAWEERTTALFRRAAEQGLLVDEARPSILGRHMVALTLGHQVGTASLPPPDGDGWGRMSESWDSVLSTMATPAWVATWRESGWHERERPCPVPARADDGGPGPGGPGPL